MHLPKQTKSSDTDSEQQKNIPRSRAVGKTSGGQQFREKGRSSGTFGWCWPLIWVENRDCFVIVFHLCKERFSLVSTESFAFSPSWLLAVFDTTFSLYKCSGVRPMAAGAFSCCSRGQAQVDTHTSHPPARSHYSEGHFRSQHDSL